MQPLGLLFHLSVSFSFFLVLLPFPFPPPHPPRSALYRLGCAFLFIQSHISCFLPPPPPPFFNSFYFHLPSLSLFLACY